MTVYNYAENRVPGGIDLWGLQFAPPPLPGLPLDAPPRFNDRFPNYQGAKSNSKLYKSNNLSTKRGGIEVLTGWGLASGTLDLPKGTSDSVVDEFYAPSSAGHKRWFSGLAESIANLALHFSGKNKSENKSSSDGMNVLANNNNSPRIISVESLEDFGFRRQEGVDTVEALSRITFANDSVSVETEQYERKNDGKKSSYQPLSKKNQY